MPQNSIKTIQKFKLDKKKFATLTAYDYTSAKIVDSLGIPLILVGDSASMVVYGYDTTIPITMDEMLFVASSVVKGTKNALVVADMPFMSYQASIEQALENAGKFIKNAGAGASKLEGGEETQEEPPQTEKTKIDALPFKGGGDVDTEEPKSPPACCIFVPVPDNVYVALNFTISVLVGTTEVDLTVSPSEEYTAAAVCIVPPLVETSSIPEPAIDTLDRDSPPILSSTIVVDAAYIGSNKPVTEALK